MKKKTWIILIVAVLVLGLGYLAYSMFFHSGADALTVSQLKLQNEANTGQRVSVEGTVVSGSVKWDSEQKVTRFTLTDNKENIETVYKGTVPDEFKPGAKVVVQGRYGTNGIFEALSFVNQRSICQLCH